MQSEFEREIYAGRISSETGVTRDAILKEAERERKALLRERKREEERKTLDPISALMPKDKSARYKNPRSAIAEEGLLSLCVSDAKLAVSASEKLSGKMFSSELLGKAFDSVCHYCRDTGLDADMHIVCENMTEDEASHIAAVFARRENLRREALPDYIDIITQENMKGRGTDDDAALLAAAEFYRKKKGI